MPTQKQELIIQPPNFQVVEFEIQGTAPYVANRFSKLERLMAAQEAGPTARSKSKKAREPRDFDGDFQQSVHISDEGWHGIPAPAFRNALISACRVAGFAMTRAKLAIFPIADGFDHQDGTPLIKIRSGKPQKHITRVKNVDGSLDIRARAMFLSWKCLVKIRFDGDQFTTTDLTNLMERAGLQVGIGEGRPDSPKSAGMGWGTFTTQREKGEKNVKGKFKKRT